MDKEGLRSEKRFYTGSAMNADEKQKLTSDAANDPFRFSRRRRTWLWATSISHDMGAVRFAIRAREERRGTSNPMPPILEGEETDHVS